jgi:O-antigen/teichoic acid export membrane protein
MFINVSTTLAYFNLMGEGKLKWIVLSILISYLVNIILSYPLGSYFGGMGIILSFNIALVLHGLLLLSTFHKLKEIKIFDIISRSDLKLFFSSIMLMIFSNYSFNLILNIRCTPMQIIVYIFSISLFVFYALKNPTFTILGTLIRNLFKTVTLKNS